MKFWAYSICLILFLHTKAEAQETFELKGIIFQLGGTERISKATVYNKTKNFTSLSDEFGTFSLPTAVGDTIILSKSNYQESTKIIAKKQNIIVYLKLALKLEEVVVKGKSIRQEQLEILDGYRAKGVYNNGKTPFLMYIFSPLTALNNLLGGDAKNARNFSRYIARENAETVVDRRFNINLIKNNTPIKDTEIAEFMYLHRPKYEVVKYWNDYDAINYIKKEFKKYQKTK
ncbi:MAG: hypothetical protein EAZ51_07665 [Sphingobacteriales bacterium]|nr:MAG: hypothetical protein EAZ64_05485 [Sphingobacteriales bacterium]TAF79437.1 MAG: hypothetical protein EAZ51_07665 [Sphingobacteriales bacterium]